ncbi:MAG TPA: S9 family peptidase, partial [Gemmatimonadales bacterium]|nr:S9 family peptidase [Gemmatimonadales bacterium]
MPIYPVSPVSDAVEVLHGETSPDPYRWLEDGNSADTRQWTEAQNALTRSYLDGIPARARIRARLDQLLSIDALGAPTPVHGRY